MKVLRVFVSKNGEFGNPVGIVVDEERKIDKTERQKITAKTGFSECVFINNLSSGGVSVFNPQEEVDFAGYALVGAVFYINKVLGKPVDCLKCGSGEIKTWQENDLTWIRAKLAGMLPWKHKQMESVDLVLGADSGDFEHTMVWAWEDEKKGIVRARTFAPDWGIPEDEANGSGSMHLAAMLKRFLEIHHGKGSVIYARLAENGMAEVGGRVKELVE